MGSRAKGLGCLGAVWILLACAGTAGAQDARNADFVRFDGAPCPTPDVYDSHERGTYDRGVIVNQGNVVEMKTRRTYFLDYPCDLEPGEEVTFVLSLHGAGSYGNWQRHYFPIKDFVDQYRLVVATPNSPTHVWSEADDEYLHDIVDSVVGQIGRENIGAFWLVGHSQGGLTSQRIVCTPYFRDKVDGFLSLSGGRVGGNPGRGNFGFGPPPGRGGAPAGRGRGGPPPAAAGGRSGTSGPDCDFSHIYETGSREMDEAGLPTGSTWADKYGCGQRVGPREIVDTQAGYVYDSSRLRTMSRPWGLLPAPGTAEVYEFRGCRDGRVVADVVRVDKGHTEGLEPHVTEELIKLMRSAAGGKLQRAGS